MNQLPTIHTMWLGDTLSRLEILTLASLLAKGHRVTLWIYDEIKSPLPHGIKLADAEQMFPRIKIRPKAYAEPEIGIGKGSVGGVFSDLFRYRVLSEHGGIWADMDVTALRPFDFPQDYAFRPHRLGMVGSIMKCPPGSVLMREVYQATEKIASESTPWLRPIEILNEFVRAMDLERFIIPEMSNRDKFADVRPFIESRQCIPEKWYAIHWMNERWRTLRLNPELSGIPSMDTHLPDKNSPAVGSTLHDLYLAYGLINGRDFP